MPSSKSICLYSSFRTTPCLPLHVQVYLSELVRQFDEVIYLHNDDMPLADLDRDWLRERSIISMPVRNEGLDFGMWLKAWNTLAIENYQYVCLANDSCVLIRKLDDLLAWLRSCPDGLYGVTASVQIAYHLQSYFLVIKGRHSIRLAGEHFSATGLIKTGYEDVVRQYEIGLSRLFLERGTPCAPYLTKPSESSFLNNPAFLQVHNTISLGGPFIKRKTLCVIPGRSEFRNYYRDGRPLTSVPALAAQLESTVPIKDRICSDFLGLLASAIPAAKLDPTERSLVNASFYRLFFPIRYAIKKFLLRILSREKA